MPLAVSNNEVFIAIVGCVSTVATLAFGFWTVRLQLRNRQITEERAAAIEAKAKAIEVKVDANTKVTEKTHALVASVVPDDDVNKNSTLEDAATDYMAEKKERER